jgi:hypothetical protein
MNEENIYLKEQLKLSDSLYTNQVAITNKQDTMIVNMGSQKDIQAGVIERLEKDNAKLYKSNRLIKRLVPLAFVGGVLATVFTVRLPIFP